ncbi:MAG: EVE domain-containing protein [Roseomonas sp.]|nr:EVE domain-containing protein [Roseomonas sp.]
MNGGWIAVACADHVALGVAGGFMQVCHGKAAPLRRMRAGEYVAYYSPTQAFRVRQSLQAFTAIGIIRDSEPYRFDMGAGFQPWRRNVDWLVSQPADIRPLLGKLEFTSGRGSAWGFRLRFGVLAVSDADMAAIVCAMGAILQAAKADAPQG